MKLARLAGGELCVVDGSRFVDVTSALSALPAASYPYPRHDVFIASLDGLKPEIDRLSRVNEPLAVFPALAAPVANCNKIVAAPVNYAKHLAEVMQDPQIHNDKQIDAIQRAGCFLKATSSIVGAGEGVRLRLPERRTDHEVELAVVIGRRCSQVSQERALECVAGYCIGLDMTIRGPEERSFRKSPDSYTVLGPWLVTADEVPDPGCLDISLQVNGRDRQRSNTSELILGVPELIAFCSRFYTLHPGDVILTGTPEGVGPVSPGDVLEAEIESIGRMTVAIRPPGDD